MKKTSSLSANTIKINFIDWMIAKNRNLILGNEVLFSENKRRADLIIINAKSTTAFEIKGDLDNTLKLKEQLKDYLKTFDKVVVICTKKLFNKISKMIPAQVGIILYDNDKFITIKRPKVNLQLSKLSLLHFCKKNEISRFLKGNKTILSTDETRLLVAKKLRLQQIKTLTRNVLLRKLKPLSAMFLQDRGKYTIKDDLFSLTGEIQKIK